MTGFKSWHSYYDFEQSVRRNLRYLHADETRQFLDAVLETAPSRKVSLSKGWVFWRAQLGHSWEMEKRGDEEKEVLSAHPEMRMKPLRHRAAKGRVNPKGIPCLYLATARETAMSEVRPWIGSWISVAEFALVRTLEIVDCSRGHADPDIVYFDEQPSEKIEEAVWLYIDKGFAEPTTRGDDTADYVGTQILAELFKKAGFDGVAYKSKFGKDGYNIALFDIDAAELVNRSLYRVDSINMKFSEHTNPLFLAGDFIKGAER